MAQNAPQPRVDSSDDGGVGLEWENGRRELFVEISPNGSTEWLQVEDGTELPPVIDGDPERFGSWLLELAK